MSTQISYICYTKGGNVTSCYMKKSHKSLYELNFCTDTLTQRHGKVNSETETFKTKCNKTFSICIYATFLCVYGRYIATRRCNFSGFFSLKIYIRRFSCFFCALHSFISRIHSLFFVQLAFQERNVKLTYLVETYAGKLYMHMW